MPILATLGKFFGSLIFTLSLGMLIVVLALAKFTEYETLQPVVTSVLATTLSKETGERDSSELQQQVSALKERCSGIGGKENLEVDLSEPIGQVQLKCADVLAIKSDEFPELLSRAVFDKIYYKKYPCDFLQCVKMLRGNERFAIFLTEVANEFFASLIIPLAAISVFGVVLIAVSIRNLYEIAKSIGISCVFIGIPFFLLPLIQNVANSLIPSGQAAEIQPIITKIFESMKMNFLVVFAAGIALTIIGFVGGYFQKKSKKLLRKRGKVVL